MSELSPQQSGRQREADANEDDSTPSDDFDPASCVPVPAGSFVRRVAGTPHYDGVIRNHAEPAIIAICGMGPVGYKLVDPSKPGWRPV